MKSPLIPMLAITGRPNKEKIENFMNGLIQNGIEQVMLYPRSGCELDYLSDEWFSVIGQFIEIAEKLDMCVWIYDEFNWPSGDAGGLVTKHEKFRLKSITVKGENIGKITTYSDYNIDLFGEKFFPDLLSEDAVDYFIELTHKEYYRRFKKYFGNIIKGIFTDEPSISYCCTPDSIPYYDGIEDDYKKYYKRDFNTDLRDSYEFFTEYSYNVIAKRFKNCYVKKVKNWCEKHNIFLTGHLIYDDEPFTSTRNNGNLLENLSEFSIPGIDNIYTDFNEKTLLTLFGSAEYASGENGSMIELFALGPCDMSYSTKLCMIYLASCFKIDHYYLAVSHLDMRGNTKISDYFNDFSTSQPDFGGNKILAREAEIAANYAKKDFVPDVYIRYPSDICAKNILTDFNTDPFVNIVNTLSKNQIQWKYALKSDNCNDIPLIDFNERMEYVYGDMITDNPQDIISELNIKHVVTDADGNIPDGLFVRKYDDGTVIIINLYGKASDYVINGQKIYIDKHGIYTSDAVRNKYMTDAERKNITNDFSLEYVNDNVIRAMYINGESNAEICSDDKMPVRFAVRNDAEAYISDSRIICKNNAEKLPDGLKNLYKASDRYTLHEGTNVLKSSDDYKYLPSVFITGNFSVRTTSGKICNLKLYERKITYSCGDYFNDYGKIEYTAFLKVPNNAKFVEIKGTGLYTSVYMYGENIGEKICTPYIYEVPSQLYNKEVELKIVQCSSIAPIFGDTKYFDDHSETAKWKGTPNTQNIKFGFSEINWIFDI